MDETIKEENPAAKEESSSGTTSATTSEAPPARITEKIKELPEVRVVRNWKDYFGESLLIVFSVILALGLTEVINNINEKRRTKEILHQLKEELIDK